MQTVEQEKARSARLAYMREYRKKNKRRITEQQKEWRKNNKDKVALYQERYWAKKAEQESED